MQSTVTMTTFGWAGRPFEEAARAGTGAGAVVGPAEGRSMRACSVPPAMPPGDADARRRPPPVSPPVPHRLRIGIEAHVVDRHPSGNGRVVANLVRALGRVCQHELFVYVTDQEVAAAWAREAPGGTTVRHIKGGGNPLLRIPFELPAL